MQRMHQPPCLGGIFRMPGQIHRHPPLTPLDLAQERDPPRTPLRQLLQRQSRRFPLEAQLSAVETGNARRHVGIFPRALATANRQLPCAARTPFTVRRLEPSRIGKGVRHTPHDDTRPASNCSAPPPRQTASRSPHSASTCRACGTYATPPRVALGNCNSDHTPTHPEPLVLPKASHTGDRPADPWPDDRVRVEVTDPTRAPGSSHATPGEDDETGRGPGLLDTIAHR